MCRGVHRYVQICTSMQGCAGVYRCAGVYGVCTGVYGCAGVCTGGCVWGGVQRCANGGCVYSCVYRGGWWGACVGLCLSAQGGVCGCFGGGIQVLCVQACAGVRVCLWGAAWELQGDRCACRGCRAEPAGPSCCRLHPPARSEAAGTVLARLRKQSRRRNAVSNSRRDESRLTRLMKRAATYSRHSSKTLVTAPSALPPAYFLR